jgi:hypothetical protein
MRQSIPTLDHVRVDGPPIEIEEIPGIEKIPWDDIPGDDLPPDDIPS